MGAAYSQDLRDRILAAYDRGMQSKQIAETFAVSRSWARRVKQRRRDFGETTPRKMGGPGPIKINKAALAQLVAEQPDATLIELRDRLGVECSESAVCIALKKMGLTFKKRQSMLQNRTVRMSHGDAGCGDASNRGVTHAV